MTIRLRAASTTALRPALRGTILALVSALAFGLATPLVQRFGHGVGSFATAALLYTGAAVVGLVTQSKDEAQAAARASAPHRRVAVLGAGLAPAALAWGLARTSGTAASLMLNLEAVFTIVLARLFYAEHVGRRVAVAAALLVAGGALLVFDRGRGTAARRTSSVSSRSPEPRSAGRSTTRSPSRSPQLDPAAVVAAKGALGRDALVLRGARARRDVACDAAAARARRRRRDRVRPEPAPLLQGAARARRRADRVGLRVGAVLRCAPRVGPRRARGALRARRRAPS